MKKRLALVLAVTLLLCACTPQTSPEPSTTDPQATTTGGRDYPRWYAQELAVPLTYETLTTMDIPYSGGRWLISGEKGAAIYQVQVNAGRLEVADVQNPKDPVRVITLPQELEDGYALGGDGQVSYVATDTRISAVDLYTEKVTPVLKADRLLDAAMVSYDMIYYAKEAEGKAGIYRLYLPDMITDTVYADIPVYPASEFQLIPPETTLGSVGWTMMNPEIMEILTQEYANPQSVYKNTSEKYNFTDVWGQPGQIDTYQKENHLTRRICQVIQEGTGTLALVQCWYEPATGLYTQRLGAIDDCYIGTPLTHDHYHPTADAPEVPEVHFGPWQDVDAGPLPQTPEELGGETREKAAYFATLYANPYAFPTLYAAAPGEPLVNLLAEPVTQWENSQYYIYALTPDGKLMQLSLDGSIRNILYKAQFGGLRDMDYQCGMVYVLDGDSLVQIDIVHMQFRHLLEAEAMVDCGYYGKNQVYLCQSKGLHQKQYILNLETQALEEI